MLKFLSPARNGAIEPYSYRSRAKLIYTGEVIEDLDNVTIDDIVVLGRIHEAHHVHTLKRNNTLFIHDICDNKFIPWEDEGAYAKLMGQWRRTNEASCAITTTCEELKEVIQSKTNKDVFVIPDPTERQQEDIKFLHNEKIEMVYYGSWGNYEQIDFEKYKFENTNLKIITNKSKKYPFPKHLIEWDFEIQAELVRKSDIILLPVNNDFEMSKYKGNNRPVDAIRQGRFVITNATTPSWLKLKDYMWCGDIEEGFKWSINNPDKVKQKIFEGQKFIEQNYSIDVISKRWEEIYNVCNSRYIR